MLQRDGYAAMPHQVFEVGGGSEKVGPPFAGSALGSAPLLQTGVRQNCH